MAKEQKGDKLAMEDNKTNKINSRTPAIIAISAVYMHLNLFFPVFSMLLINKFVSSTNLDTRIIFIICSLVISWVGITITFISLLRHFIKIEKIRIESDINKEDILKTEANELTKYLIEKAEEKRTK